MSEKLSVLVGVDWAKDFHQVHVMDRERETLWKGRVEHSAPAIHRLADRLVELAEGEPSLVGVAIEIPRGALVDTLSEHGFQVFALNPKQTDRFRDRYSPAGAKDDSRDALVLADALRTDQHCFRQVRLDDPLVIQLREHVHMHEELRDQEVRLTNQLRALLHRYFPQALAHEPRGVTNWLLDLLEHASTPERARRLQKATVAKILKRNMIRRITADGVRAALREPSLHLTEGAADAASAHVRMLIPRLRLVRSQKVQVRRRLEQLLDALGQPAPEATETTSPEGREHRDAEILLSMPGVGTVVAATMLAEASWALEHRDYQALRGHAGIAPVTYASGTKSRVRMRKACNGRLRDACYHWARVASQHDPGCKAYYQRLRGRGHTHGRALRSVANRLLRILVAALKSHALFDPDHARPVPAAVVATG